MNILLTSVGRRGYLVDYFKQALAGKGMVIGANTLPDTAGMIASDISIVTPPSNHPEYVPFIIDICEKYNIQLMCSLHDLDVFILSQSKESFDRAGVKNTLPSADWGKLALDKFECSNKLEKAGIAVPWTTVKLEDAFTALANKIIKFPIIVKARIGFGSLGVKICQNEKELIDGYQVAKSLALNSVTTNFIKLSEDELVIIQPVIDGREICLAIVNNLNGEYQNHFSCEVHSMRAGESDLATSLDRSQFTSLAKKVSKLTSHSGIWGVDFLDDDGVLKAIDVNPRFTGDYPFHHLAGANIPLALINWASWNEAESFCFNATPGIKAYKDLVPKKI